MGLGALLRLVAMLALASGLALGFSTSAQAQAGLAGRSVPVCVARAVAGMEPRRLFATPARFDCTTPQVDLGSGDYWVLSAPLPADTGTIHHAAVRTASMWQDRMTLYALYADGAIAAMPTDDHEATRQIQLGAIIQRVLPHRTASVKRLLWHVEGSANMRGIIVGARIADLNESARSNLMMAAFYSAFAGLCIALLVYNIALWGALRYRFQLAYCAMVCALLAYACSSSGALAWLIPGIANTMRLRVNYLSLGLSACAALVFARAFFEERVFATWLGTITNAALAGLLTATIAFAVFAPWQIHLLDHLFSLSFMPLIAVVAPMLWRAWKERSNYLWLFAISWAAPVAFAVVRVFNNLHPLAWSFWIDNSTILSMSMEALLSSLAIAYRIRLLSLDRDEARAQEIAARLLADTDPLTGLFNRRAFLRDAIGREGEQLLLIVDIDHFKRVNETIGHDGGDEVLRVFTRTLRASIPAEAIVARLGGEEFAILTPVSHPVKGDDILARLRSARMPFDLCVTASIGACVGTLASEADWKALYRCGDRALFEAKAAGRDRAREGLRAAA